MCQSWQTPFREQYTSVLQTQHGRYDTQHNDTQHNDTQHYGRALLCCVSFLLSVIYVSIMLTVTCSESVTYKPFMLSVVMLNAVMLNAIMLSFVMLNAVMLSVAMLNVVAPSACGLTK
jgi:hypothetical protein